MNSLVDVYPYRVADDAIELLVCRRAWQALYAGQWRMIGGKVKEGESFRQAALRELNEETGILPKRFWTIPSLNHFYDPKYDTIRLIPAFAAQLPLHSEIVLNEEHSEYRWIAVEEIEAYIEWPEQIRLMKLTHRILTSNRNLEQWEIEIG